jgi:hypothetical protein
MINKLLDIASSSGFGVAILGVGLTTFTSLLLWVFWLIITLPNQ